MTKVEFHPVSLNGREEPIIVNVDESADGYSETLGRAALEIVRSMNHHNLLKSARVEVKKGIWESLLSCDSCEKGNDEKKEEA